jgi:5-formyltetrahydrofolate cyclo-ligase
MSNSTDLRKRLLIQRQALASDIQKKETFEHLFNEKVLDLLKSPQFKDIYSVAFYWPIQGEPDLRGSLTKWLMDNPKRSLGLPITQKDQVLRFYRWDQNTQMSAGLYGISEPKNTEQITPDLILIPCLGWQASNGKLWRLGYGGGYYDKTIADLYSKNHHPNLIGIGYSDLKLNQNIWRPQSHDAPLNALITEYEIINPTHHD